MRQETLAVHAGRTGLRSAGVHASPIDLSTTYPLSDMEAGGEALQALAEGAPTASTPVYGRLYNPTVGRFEEGLAQLEGAQAAVAFASGMAAITALLMIARGHGEHVVAVRPLYGGSDHLLSAGLCGLPVTWARPEEVADKVTEKTAFVLCETPANPTLALIDIEQIVRDSGDVPVVVDSTFATPILQNPLRLGARLVVHSATKFLGGHGDVMGGVVAGCESLCAELRSLRAVTGAVLHPLAGYLLHRGLQTLSVRVRTQQAGARIIAERLAENPHVRRVYYPGFGSESDRKILQRQMAGPGSLIAFELDGGREAASRMMSAVRLALPAVSLGATDTLIQHPAALTHRIVEEEVRSRHAVSGALLRVSVGLEHPEDLWQDLQQALSRAHSDPPVSMRRTA